MRPTIGITSGVVVNKDYPNTPAVMGQQYTYIHAVLRAGGLPLILPIIEDKRALKQLYDLCDGIIFAGGNDIDPACYGEKASPLLSETDPDRDRQELMLWKYAREDDIPVLGICRGMQLINVGSGGSLIQDIPSELPNAEVHRVSPDKSQPDDYEQILHHISIKPGSRLAKILGVTNKVGTNAFHHQAVKKLGEGFIAIAWTDDKVIEGMEMSGKRFVVGVQSHPESLESKVEPIWRNLFREFVAAASS